MQVEHARSPWWRRSRPLSPESIMYHNLYTGSATSMLRPTGANIAGGLIMKQYMGIGMR
jgi:hypothetical protein